MEYKKIINLLRNVSNQPSKCRTKKMIQINDQSRGTSNTNIDIRFKNAAKKANLYDHSNVYILAKGRIIFGGSGDTVVNRQEDERNKDVIIKCCAPFTVQK